MANINDLFATTPDATASKRNLSGTARLTQIASKYANDFIQLVEADCISRDDITAALKSNNAMDDLINSNLTIDLSDDDRWFFEDLGSETGEKMLKSQQSKRSRCKSKTMTTDNFRNLLVASIAEIILRDVFGMAKNGSTSTARRASISYTDEELDALANDQAALKKAIRNIQSKKSIMKSKAGFDANSEQWQQLLEVESQLKSRRVATARTHTVKVDETRSALTTLLTDVDVSKMTKNQLTELIANIQGLTTES